MPDAPDPLGKRALFWAPAERDEEGPRNSAESDVPGRTAVFSDAAVAGTRLGPDRRTRATPLTGRSGHPSRGEAEPAPARRRRAGLPLDDLERPAGSGMFGTLELRCSSCRCRSEVDLVEFVILHLPLWLWRPGRGYSRFMTCPACRRRSWVSASWSSWSR